MLCDCREGDVGPSRPSIRRWRAGPASALPSVLRRNRFPRRLLPRHRPPPSGSCPSGLNSAAPFAICVSGRVGRGRPLSPFDRAAESRSLLSPLLRRNRFRPRSSSLVAAPPVRTLTVQSQPPERATPSPGLIVELELNALVIEDDYLDAPSARSTRSKTREAGIMWTMARALFDAASVVNRCVYAERAVSVPLALRLAGGVQSLPASESFPYNTRPRPPSSSPSPPSAARPGPPRRDGTLHRRLGLTPLPSPFPSTAGRGGVIEPEGTAPLMVVFWLMLERRSAPKIFQQRIYVGTY